MRTEAKEDKIKGSKKRLRIWVKGIYGNSLHPSNFSANLELCKIKCFFKESLDITESNM